MNLWSVGLPILVVDVLNPVLLAAVLFALTTARPYASSLAVIIGHTAAYFTAGLLVIFGLAEILNRFLDPVLERLLNNPQPMDFVISLAVGLALIVIALRWRMDPPEPSEKPPEPASQGLLSSFFLGAIINFVGLPFAVPYLAFLSQLLKLEPAQTIFPLAIYNLLYAAPFLAFPLVLRLVGPSAMSVLQRINAFVESKSAYIMPLLLLGLGLGLVADAGTYFATGKGLY